MSSQRVAREAVGLGVDDEELGGRERAVEHPREVLRALRTDGTSRCAGSGGRPGPTAGGVRCDVHRLGRRHRNDRIGPAPHPGTERAGREREAWDAYRDSLRELEGREYEEAERASWERLQGALADARGRRPRADAGGLASGR